MIYCILLPIVFSSQRTEEHCIAREGPLQWLHHRHDRCDADHRPADTNLIRGADQIRSSRDLLPNVEKLSKSYLTVAGLFVRHLVSAPVVHPVFDGSVEADAALAPQSYLGLAVINQVRAILLSRLHAISLTSWAQLQAAVFTLRPNQ